VLVSFHGRITYGLLEDGRVGVGNGFPDLCVCGVGAHNAVLALGGLLRLFPEGGLEGLVLLDRLLEPAVCLGHVVRTLWVASLALRFEELHAADEPAVGGHDLCAEVVDLVGGHVWPRERLPEDAVEVAELAIELVDFALDGYAVVADVGGAHASIAVAVFVHLYVLAACGGCEKEWWHGVSRRAVRTLVVCLVRLAVVTAILLLERILTDLAVVFVVAELFAHVG